MLFIHKAPPDTGKPYNHAGLYQSCRVFIYTMCCIGSRYIACLLTQCRVLVLIAEYVYSHNNIVKKKWFANYTNEI